MTNRVSYAPQDFQRMCEHAERDHESRKVLVLLERVKQQIAVRDNPALQLDLPKPPVTAITARTEFLRAGTHPAPFER
jgi:hypothetical protein